MYQHSNGMTLNNGYTSSDDSESDGDISDNDFDLPKTASTPPPAPRASARLSPLRIPKREGHKFQYLSDPDSAKPYQCKICFKVARNAVKLTCPQHKDINSRFVYCEDCMVAFCGSNQNLCPIREQMRPHSVTYAPASEERHTIANLRVICPHSYIDRDGSVRGCTWSGQLAGMEKHLIVECRHKEVECEYIHFGCEVAVNEKEVHSHKSEFMAQHLDLIKDNLAKLTSEHHSFSTTLKMKDEQIEILLKTVQGLTDKLRSTANTVSKLKQKIYSIETRPIAVATGGIPPNGIIPIQNTAPPPADTGQSSHLSTNQLLSTILPHSHSQLSLSELSTLPSLARVSANNTPVASPSPVPSPVPSITPTPIPNSNPIPISSMRGGSAFAMANANANATMDRNESKSVEEYLNDEEIINMAQCRPFLPSRQQTEPQLNHLPPIPIMQPTFEKRARSMDEVSFMDVAPRLTYITHWSEGHKSSAIEVSSSSDLDGTKDEMRPPTRAVCYTEFKSVRASHPLPKNSATPLYWKLKFVEAEMDCGFFIGIVSDKTSDFETCALKSTLTDAYGISDVDGNIYMKGEKIERCEWKPPIYSEDIVTVEFDPRKMRLLFSLNDEPMQCDASKKEETELRSSNPSSPLFGEEFFDNSDSGDNIDFRPFTIELPMSERDHFWYPTVSFGKFWGNTFIAADIFFS